MQCQTCGQETMMPFRCPFCGGQFCSAHRLPENHHCPQINNARAQTQQRVMTQQSNGSYNYSYVYGQNPYRKQHHIRWSHREVKHIGIAAALVIGIGFSMALYNNFFGGFNWTWDLMAIFAVFMTVSFLTHEMAHKIMAQKAGMWAEFRLTAWGAVLTLISVFLPLKVISPGAMMIGGTSPTAKEMVKISVAGVITNMIYASVFLGLALGLPFTAYTEVLIFVAYINSFMAIFNLLPWGILDGYKLLMLNKTVWVLAIIPAVILTLLTGWCLFSI